MKKTFLIFLFLLSLNSGHLMASQDSLMIKKIFDQELNAGLGHQNLYKLCKGYADRLSGSRILERAIDWSEKLMLSYDFDTVFRQEVMVPHWVRGDSEVCIVSLGDRMIPLNVCALGGSIATPEEGLEAPLVMIENDDEWKSKGEAGELKDKIVFVNIAMPTDMVNAFDAYGHCWNVRGLSAIKAAKYGARGVIIRSLSQTINPYPHTGVMFYSDTIPQIPAMAMSTADAEMLSARLQNHSRLKMYMQQNCRTLEDKKSYNLVAEIRAEKPTNEYITIGGHLDAWDMGEGAHDDGAGVMQCLDALWLLKENYTPNKNIRCVFFTNEENGNRGGKKYAELAKLNGEKQVYALESDAGAYVPRGFGVDIADGHQKHYEDLIDKLRAYYMNYLEYEGGGVDIGPMRDQGTILSYLITDSQRYFDVHHSDNDVWENVNEREFKLGAAGIAAWIYLMDAHGSPK